MTVERLLHILRLRWLSLFRRNQVDRDLDDELRFHVEAETARLVAAGQDPESAADTAYRSLHGLERTAEQCRDTRGVAWAETLVQDLRYGARTLARNPGFTLAATVTLALGIGANTAVFTLLDGIVFAPLPFPDDSRLVSLQATYPAGGLVALREQLKTLDAASYATAKHVTLGAPGGAVRVSSVKTSAELFTVLGVRPAIGRVFRSGEDRAPGGRIAVLSHRSWVARFGADPTIVGRSVLVDGTAREIVGVMPPEFGFPASAVELWLPLTVDAGDTVAYWAGDFMPIVGRLRPGVDISQAQAEARLFQARIGERFPWRMPEDWNKDLTVIPLQQALVGDVTPRLMLLSIAVALVLVIACANVANLSLTKTAARAREIGIRSALGAGPRRIARQLLTESALLGLLGGIAGALVAVQMLSLLKIVLPPDTPRLMEVQLNWRVLAFTAAIALGAGCLFGLAPVLQAMRLRLRDTLDSAGRGAAASVGAPARAALTIAQIAGAVVLVIAAGLLVRSLWILTSADPGFRPDAVVTARVAPAATTCATAERCLVNYQQLVTSASAMPGIRDAALVNTLPLTGEVAKRSLQLEGFVPEPSKSAPLFWLHAITPRYFDVMGARLEAGRAFTDADVSGHARVAVVTATTARRYWPRESALGKQLRFVGENEWRTIVGVVGDLRAYDLTRPEPEWIDGTIYVPFNVTATLEDGAIPTQMTLVARGSGTSALSVAALGTTAQRAGGDLMVSDIRPMSAIVAERSAAPSATAALLVSMAVMALVLGSVGVYGVLSFLVSRRTRDLGVRMALGATPKDVFLLVIGEGARLCVAGIALGVAGALALTRWLQSELHGVSATDPATYALVVLVVALVTLAACYVPTRRAMAVDPLVALRDS